MAETLSMISIISYAIAGVCILLSVFLWFFFKIPQVIGDLSGRTARKSIAKMRAANEKTGNKAYKESKTNAARGKLTGSMPNSAKADSYDAGNPETGVLAANKALQLDTNETAALDGPTTELLVDENVIMLINGSDKKQEAKGKKFDMIDEVMLVHTEEVIG